MMRPRKEIDAILRRMLAWPQDAREERARIAHEIKAELRGGGDRPAPEQPPAAERASRYANADKIATDQEIEAILAKYRRG